MNFQPDSKLMKFMTWLSDMVHLQFLWFAGIFLGVGIVGFFPATTSLLAVQRKMIQQDREFSFQKEFWKEYKLNFFKANQLGYSVVLIGLILILYLRLSTKLPNSFSLIFVFLSYVLLIFFLLAVLYLFSSFVHFDLGLGKIVRQALTLMILSPLATVGTAIISLIFIWSIITFPVLLPFVSVSIFFYGVLFIYFWNIKRISKLIETK